MAVRIRLRRMGAKKRPFYRLVVADSRAPRNGSVIEFLGEYNPQREPTHIKVNVERARYWLSQGAQPSDTARRILQQAGTFDAEQSAEAVSEQGAASEQADSASS